MTTSTVKATKAIFQDQAIFKRSYWSLGKVISLLLLIGISILFIIPLLWMISTSLKEAQDLVGTRWIPTRLAWENYVDAFSFGMWPQWLLNTESIDIILPGQAGRNPTSPNQVLCFLEGSRNHP